MVPVEIFSIIFCFIEEITLKELISCRRICKSAQKAIDNGNLVLQKVIMDNRILTDINRLKFRSIRCLEITHKCNCNICPHSYHNIMQYIHSAKDKRLINDIQKISNIIIDRTIKVDANRDFCMDSTINGNVYLRNVAIDITQKEISIPKFYKFSGKISLYSSPKTVILIHGNITHLFYYATTLSFETLFLFNLYCTSGCMVGCKLWCVKKLSIGWKQKMDQIHHHDPIYRLQYILNAIIVFFPNVEIIKIHHPRLEVNDMNIVKEAKYLKKVYIWSYVDSYKCSQIVYKYNKNAIVYVNGSSTSLIT
jgi:hypothetical protein